MNRMPRCRVCGSCIASERITQMGKEAATCGHQCAVRWRVGGARYNTPITPENALPWEQEMMKFRKDWQPPENERYITPMAAADIAKVSTMHVYCWIGRGLLTKIPRTSGRRNWYQVPLSQVEKIAEIRKRYPS